MYLLDPQQGRRRRHVARDRGLKLLRRKFVRLVEAVQYHALGEPPQRPVAMTMQLKPWGVLLTKLLVPAVQFVLLLRPEVEELNRDSGRPLHSVLLQDCEHLS